jgi:UDP-glucuronate 4-epimerase
MSRIVDLRSGATPTAVVTGCAGFIGSHLSKRLVADGVRVIGIDAFRPYYDVTAKVDNLTALTGEANFELLEVDLTTADLASIMSSAGTVFHIAAQPGVRRSFGDGFTDYALDNVVATQRVFEAAAASGCPRVVWASSSSVYGDAAAYPCVESTTPTQPRSPYGVTKRACEDLAAVYRMQGLSVVGLRYFTVYGPRQRPDMAIRRLCEALVGGGSFPLFGDGNQTRDITYVSDVVEATVLAGRAVDPEPIYNVGGGHEVTLNQVIAMLEELAGRRVEVERFPVQAGDVRRTGADSTAARQSLGWNPRVPLAEGLANELEWVQAANAARVA